MKSQILLFSSLAALVAGQMNPVNPMQIAPSNNSGPSNFSISLLVTANGSQSNPFSLDSAYTQLPPNSVAEGHLEQSWQLNGDIVLTTNASDAATLNPTAVGYVCCDAGAYNDTNGLNELLQAAANAINSSSTAALVFYSRTQDRCGIDAPGPFAATPNLFTMTNASSALALESLLRSAAAPAQAAVSNTPQKSKSPLPSPSSSDDGDMNSSSPGATVAMIILYIITGLITLCFLSVIIAGAIRAHRHPEWYRDFDQEGGAGRRRVLGRAILDSIPIIKFGEQAPSGSKDAEPATDIELEEGRNVAPASSPPATPPAKPMETCPVHNVPVQPAQPEVAPAPAAAPIPSDVPGADDPLECAICVEPFQQGDDMRVLPQCEHKFHPACLDPWLLNVSSTCPLCRLDLRPPESTARASSDPVPGSEGEHGAGTPENENALWLIPTDRPGVYLQIDPRTMGSDRRPSPTAGHRASARLSDVWTRLLSRQRLREASPQERVVALRELREARRESEVTTAADMVIVEEDQHPSPSTEDVHAAPGEHDERRLPRVGSTRLSRLFGRRPVFPPSPLTEGGDISAASSPAVSPVSEHPPRLALEPFTSE